MIAELGHFALVLALAVALWQMIVPMWGAHTGHAAAMRALAELREPVDAFFDKVLVNSEVTSERENRLRLLIKVRDAMGRVADFGQITG